MLLLLLLLPLPVLPPPVLSLEEERTRADTTVLDCGDAAAAADAAAVVGKPMGAAAQFSLPSSFPGNAVINAGDDAEADVVEEAEVSGALVLITTAGAEASYCKLLDPARGMPYTAVFTAARAAAATSASALRRGGAKENPPATPLPSTATLAGAASSGDVAASTAGSILDEVANGTAAVVVPVVKLGRVGL